MSLMLAVSSSILAAGGMVPPEKLPTACKGGGLRKRKMPFHQAMEVCLKRGGCMLAVLISNSLLINLKPIAAGGLVPPERLPSACRGGGLKKHKMPAIHAYALWSHSTKL